MDGEGTPTQELAAIEVNVTDFSIMDIFHGFAFSEVDDGFARRHIHGLNKDFLKAYGYESEAFLVGAFRKWLHKKRHVSKVFANGAQRESQSLGIVVHDFLLLPWAQREHCLSHERALDSKRNNLPIFCADGSKMKCCDLAHSSFISCVNKSNSVTARAKAKHGYHCALYDVLELYYVYVTLNTF